MLCKSYNKNPAIKIPIFSAVQKYDWTHQRTLKKKKKVGPTDLLTCQGGRFVTARSCKRESFSQTPGCINFHVELRDDDAIRPSGV